jgi:dTDP-4-amino-4,6-dideoxygalactose transaminase
MSFDKILKFEQELATFTGAPYAIMTDCCTHAIELALRYDNVKMCYFTPFTYVSIPMTMHKLGINYSYSEEDEEHWIGEYRFFGTRIFDSARRLEPGMYRKGKIQCLSFGHGKPLQVGRGGAILLDDKVAYETMLLQRYDGRDLTIDPWVEQKTFKVGYHYKPTIEEAEAASIELTKYIGKGEYAPVLHQYPDCRTITIE